MKLSDGLKHIGADRTKCAHVIMQGSVDDIAAVPYDASIPAETEFDANARMILVWGYDNNNNNIYLKSNIQCT